MADLRQSRARAVALVSGRVQGVGFRDWVRRRAEGLGLSGSASNLRDGRVEVIAEGERGDVEALLDVLRSPQAPGAVGEVAVEWTSATGGTGGFGIR